MRARTTWSAPIAAYILVTNPAQLLKIYLLYQHVNLGERHASPFMAEEHIQMGIISDAKG